MYFYTDYERKIIFGWTPKCGCTHVRNIFFYLSENKKLFCNLPKFTTPLPRDTTNFTFVLFTRNPYKRLVSGFLDKYDKGGLIHLWKTGLPLTFKNFVNHLGTSHVQDFHFSPQVSGDFNFESMKNCKIIVYDIENIDYKNIEHLFGKKIPDDILYFKGDHNYRIADASCCLELPVYNMLIDQIKPNKVDCKWFYDEEILSKVNNYYRDDLTFLKSCGLNYSHT